MRGRYNKRLRGNDLLLYLRLSAVTTEKLSISLSLSLPLYLSLYNYNDNIFSIVALVIFILM